MKKFKNSRLSTDSRKLQTLALKSSINAIELLTERNSVIKLLLLVQINCLHYPSPPNLFPLSNRQIIYTRQFILIKKVQNQNDRDKLFLR